MNKTHVKRAGTAEKILAYAVLAVLSFLCLFFFYILIVNSTRSHADLQKGFSWLPGNYFFENLTACTPMTSSSRSSPSPSSWPSWSCPPR